MLISETAWFSSKTTMDPNVSIKLCVQSRDKPYIELIFHQEALGQYFSVSLAPSLIFGILISFFWKLLKKKISDFFFKNHQFISDIVKFILMHTFFQFRAIETFKNYQFISNMLKFMIMDTYFQFRAIEIFFFWK